MLNKPVHEVSELKYTIKEASKFSRMSESWWRQQCYKRAIRFYKLGSKVLIPESTIKGVMNDSVVLPKNR